MLYTEDLHHSLLLSGDADRSCSMFGRDFVVGGEDAADGGDAAESAPSRAASALGKTLAFGPRGYLTESLPESIYARLILLLLFFHWRCASSTTPGTVFSLRK